MMNSAKRKKELKALALAKKQQENKPVKFLKPGITGENLTGNRKWN